MGKVDTAVHHPELDECSVRTEATGPCYLLFAGADAVPMGGMADLVGAVTSEKAARAAFRRVRLETATSPSSWAHLAVVRGEDGIKPLCWFGIGATPTPIHRAVSANDHHGVTVQIPTVDHRPEHLLQTEPPRRCLWKKVTAVFAGMLTAGVLLIGALFHPGLGDRIDPSSTMSRDVARTGDAAMPFPVHCELALNGDSSPDR